jgi:hypothetical protein
MTPDDSYPSAPPFPHQATHSIAQARAAAGPDEPETVTLIRDGVHYLQVMGDKYLAGYDPGGVSRGAVVALHGEHGAGKTHAIGFVMQYLGGRAPSFAERAKPGSLCQLYAKVDALDPVQLYRSLMSQVALAPMRELSRVFLSVVAAEQGVGGDGDKQQRAAVKRRFRESPALVERLFESYRLEPGAVREGGAQEIERIGEAARDFERAVTGLRMGKLARLAHRYLCGDQLDEDELDRLGVRQPIDSPELALLGLRVMARLFRRAEIPLALYVDQVEGLVLDAEGAEVGENMGFLRSIVEVLPQESAFLVVAGNLDAWRAYHRDVKQRFAEGPIFLPALTEAEAEELIVAYQAPFKPPSTGREEALYPFVEGSVPELLRSGGGNVRRFLQNCAQVFNGAFPSRAAIDAAAVRSALEQGRAPLDRASVLLRARQLLGGRGLAVDENVTVGGVAVDLAVRDGDGRRVALVKVNEAIFRTQEARDVRDSLELVRRTKAEGEVLHVVLAVLGYVSPDMTRMLEEVADDTVVCTAEGAEASLVGALARIPATAPGAPRGQGDSGVLGERIEELQRALIDVLEKRRGDDERLQAQLDALARRQDEERAQAGRDEARKTWISERARLEREIREVRAARARAEADELERMRLAAENLRAVGQRRSGVLAGLAVLLLLALVVVLAAGAHGAAALAVAALCGAGAVAGGLFAWRELEAVRRLCPPELRELVQPIASEDELYQVATRLPPQPQSYLRSPYPQLRYAAALAASGGDARTAEVLALALPRERSAIVRRAIARALGTADVVQRDFYETHELVGVPEVVYIADVSKADVGLETSQSFAAVRALREHDERAFLRIVVERALDYVTIMKLAEGHRRGLERLGPTMLRDRIPERSRRAAIEFLTPFEGSGLGGFDRLEVVREIEGWYLFFREMQWYAELGWAEWKA